MAVGPEGDNAAAGTDLPTGRHTGLVPVDRLSSAFAQAEARGWASSPGALGPDEVAALAEAVADVGLAALEPEVGPVRQAGATGVAVVAGRPAVEVLARRLAGAAAAAGVDWQPDELAVTAYAEGEGISAHRDNSFYEGFVAVITLAGEAELRAVADRAGHEELGRWPTEPGHLTVLRGPRAGGEARVLHEVGPAGAGGRRVLTLRRNARGAGAGWS